MKIKNEYVKIKQGKNEVELHNLILDKYLSLFASSVLETKYKGLDSCLINCTIQEEITPSMDAMHWDFYLNEQNLYNNSDYKGASKIITKYLYEPNFKEQIQSFIGQKILSIGFAQMVEEPTLPDGSDATFELYAILDVSNYNLYVQDMQEFVVERVDTVTTDMVFSSDTEKFPIHLSPRGNSYFDQQEEAGTREVGILNAIGKGYNSMFPTALMPKSNFNITRNENEIDITGLSIQENTGEELYPSNELYPKKKWSEEIQKGEKGSEVIIEGNDKEAFVDIEGKSEQETSTQGNNLFDEQYYNNSAIYSVNVYKYTLTKIKGNRGLYVKAQLKEGKTAQSGIYACLCSTVQPNIPESTFRWFINNGVPGTNGAVFNTTDLYFSFYPSDTPLNKIFDNYNLWVSTDDINYEPFTPESPSPDYPSEIHSVADDVNLFDYENIVVNNKFTASIVDDELIITRIASSGGYVSNTITGFEVGKEYTIKSNSSIYLYKDSVYGTLYKNTRNAQNGWTFIADKSSYVVTIILNSTDIPNIGDTLNCGKIKLQKGTIATSYSPYNQGTVTIKQRGKNLFDYNSYTYDKTIQNAYRFIEIKDLKPNTVYVISNYQNLVNSGFSNVYMARDTKYSSIIFANLVGNNNVPINTDKTGKLYLCVYASNWTEELWNTFISYFENAQLEERKNTNFIRTISNTTRLYNSNRTIKKPT